MRIHLNRNEIDYLKQILSHDAINNAIDSRLADRILGIIFLCETKKALSKTNTER